ncbi:septum formation initiator family protein [Clostridium sp.]|uniref:FtsB family cell division protein n=1 Tax=Clostridium sp. TaxID=1506 RepID=UPI003216F8E4
MLVENIKDTVYGNNALASQANPLPKERVKNPTKQGPSREELKQAKKFKMLNVLKFNGTILATGIVGAMLVSGYSSIYKNQKEIIALKDNIQVLAEESEDLSIKLLRFNNISYIEEIATKELNMVKPKTTDGVYCDLESVQSITPNDIEAVKGDNLLSKIKNLLFN